MAKPKCGSLKKSGGYCGRPAGWGTDHVGEGKCKLHGGGSLVKHGRYSKVNRPRIKDLVEQLARDDDPLDLLPDILILRALVIDFIERYDEMIDAILAWHASFSKEYLIAEKKAVERGDDPPDPLGYGKPQRVLDITAVSSFLASIGALADKIEKRKQTGRISLTALNRIIEEMGEHLTMAAAETITDDHARAQLLDSVERRWDGVRLVEQ